MKPVSRRLNRISDNFFARLDQQIAAAKQAGQQTGQPLIRLDVGSPDLPPAPHIVAALAQSAHLPTSHGYQSQAGPVELRQAWAETYLREHQVRLEPDREILLLQGTKAGIFHLTQAYLDPGDVALVPDPAYQTYAVAASFAGGEPYRMPLLAERSFLPDLAAIPADVLKKAKLLWLNYPNNPTAAVASLAFLQEAVAFARQHNLLLCHDAAYSRVTFDGYHAPSIFEVDGALEVAVEFNSLSKTYNMAGWRSGVLAGNAQAIAALFRLLGHIESGQFLPIHQAALQALTGDQAWVAERNEIYRRRRDAALNALAAGGFSLPAAPRASLYLWCPVPAGWSAVDFTTAVLEQAAVSLTPGTVFGRAGEGFFRISLTAPKDKLEAACARLAQVWSRLERTHA